MARKKPIHSRKYAREAIETESVTDPQLLLSIIIIIIPLLLLILLLLLLLLLSLLLLFSISRLFAYKTRVDHYMHGE